MKEGRMNTPFVALSAFLVGMLVTGLVVAVDPLPGPPIKVVTTYTVSRTLVVLVASPRCGPPVFLSPCPLLVVTVDCRVGDNVTGGGAEIAPAPFEEDGGTVVTNLNATRPYVNATTGAHGWLVKVQDFLGSRDRSYHLTLWAVCLHRE